MYEVIYTNRSIADLDSAMEWYESQRKGLGVELLHSVEECVHRLSIFPWSYQRVSNQIRGCPISRFPFSVYYSVENEVVVIHAVFDNRMNPQKRP